MGKDFDNQISEAETLVSAVRSSIPTQITGKIAIEIMLAEGSANWRQMEWIGFWFEHVVENQVIPKRVVLEAQNLAELNSTFKEIMFGILKSI